MTTKAPSVLKKCKVSGTEKKCYRWVNMKLIFRVTMLPLYECFEHRLKSRIHQSGKFAADDHIGRSGRMQILDNGLGDWDEAPGWYHGVGGSWVWLLPRTLSPDGKSFRQNGPILRLSASAIKSVLFMILESKQNSCFILGKSLMGLGKPLIRHIKMEVKFQTKTYLHNNHGRHLLPCPFDIVSLHLRIQIVVGKQL